MSDWNLEGLFEREVVWLDRFDLILTDAEDELHMNDAGNRQGLEVTIRLILEAVLPRLQRLESRGWTGGEEGMEPTHREVIQNLLAEVTRIGKRLQSQEQPDNDTSEGG